MTPKVFISHASEDKKCFVLRQSTEFDLVNNAYVLAPEELFTDLAALDLIKEQILESIEVLGADGYEGIKARCAGCIVNEDVSDNQTMAKKLGLPIRLVDHILSVFAIDNLIGVNEYSGGGIRIHPVSPNLRRLIS